MGLRLDPTIQLGNLLVAAMLAAIGWGLRRWYLALHEFLEEHRQYGVELDEQGEAIDWHSDALKALGVTISPRLLALRDRRKYRRRTGDQRAAEDERWR